ncbi:uncharacterized protein LOC127250723 isoform X2 [Andrographis paniculata]|uniref:uncharacterized protein LOC127250723 isoform X2 n=1 Tax=Andrographis paniculata TaxID=175694 RepID=UPI0021E736D3|nr:uncharacterized protein LOC127250723 isoform X2 [Andrographis paniculata]
MTRYRQLIRALGNPSLDLFNSTGRSASGNSRHRGCGLPPRRCFHSPALAGGNNYSNSSCTEIHNANNIIRISTLSALTQARLFSSESTNDGSADSVQDIHDKILNCVSEKRTAPPNAWLWSLVAKCSTREDITLLFNILQKLRVFRLSNLRIHDDFNSALCRDVVKACVRAGAVGFGKRALWKHNLFGLTPNIGSAHHLLLHAKQINNVKLMVEVMKLVKKNGLPLQPGTADIVFSTCVSGDRFDLITKYGKRFAASGVKLRQSSYDLWMEFAARKGDIESLWKIEKWRSKSMNNHSLSTGLSCAKGFLLEHKPESAAAMIQVLYQTLPEAKRPSIVTELQKLVGEWPLEVIKQQKKQNRKAFASDLHKDISALIDALPSVGVKADVTVRDFREAISS